VNLIEIIDNYAAICPERIVHRYRGSSLTYGQLKKRSDALASFVIGTFGRDKTPIAVFGHKQQEMLIGFLACVKAGHAYIPIDESLPAQRIQDIIESSGTKLILEISSLSAKTPGADFGVLPGNIRLLSRSEISSIIESNKGKTPSAESSVQKEETYYIIIGLGVHPVICRDVSGGFRL